MTDSVDVGILIADRELVVRSWNRWLERATGISADVAVGRPLAELAPDFQARGFDGRFAETLASGAVQVLSPTFHRYLIPCTPRTPSAHFTQMQQRVDVGPLMDGDRIEGIIVTITDVTAHMDAERRLAEFAPALAADDWKVRKAAVRALAEAANQELLQSLVETLRQHHRSFSTLSSALKVLSMSEVPMTAPLVELLQDADADLRIQAALALGEQHDPAAIDPLIRALDDAEPNVRFHAIEALGRLHATEAVDVLASIVESRDVFLAFAAIDALAQINDRRVSSRLAPLLGVEELRDAVAAALGALGDSDAVPALVDAVNNHSSAAAAVAGAMASIERHEQRELGDATHVAEVVRTRLTAAGERHLMAAIEGGAPPALSSITRVIGWLRSEATAAALVDLLSQPAVRDQAVDALEARGETAVAMLLEPLQAEDPAVVLAAVTALGRIGSRKATPALVSLLDDRTDIAIAAAGALARIGDPEAFEALLAHAGHPHAAVRQAIVGALNAIGHPEMPHRIAGLIDSDDPFVRESAVRIAGYFGYDSTVDAVLARAEDTEDTVRGAAVEHLPFIDDPRVFVAVQRALGDRSPRVRAAAARALARIDHGGAREALLWALRDGDLWVRYYAARALGERGEGGSVPALVAAACSDEAPHVRIAALDALASVGDPSAVPALLECVSQTDEDVAAAALRALGALQAVEAFPLLERGARGESVKIRLAAVAGLAALASETAVGVLAWVASADAHASVFGGAVSALAEVAASSRDGAGLAIASLLEMQADPRLADAAAAALSRLGTARLGEIAHGLRHPQPDIRRKTVDTLARMRIAPATKVLGTALEDDVAAVRETAVLALGRLGARGIKSRLQDLARTDPSKSVRRAAANAAAQLRWD